MTKYPTYLTRHVGYFASAAATTINGTQPAIRAPQLARDAATLRAIADYLRMNCYAHIADEIERRIARGKTRKVASQLRRCNLYACHDGGDIATGCNMGRIVRQRERSHS